jgi:hypothetical protein
VGCGYGFVVVVVVWVQDLVGSAGAICSVAQVEEELRVLLRSNAHLRAAPLHLRVLPCAAATGHGLKEGFNWLCQALALVGCSLRLFFSPSNF